MSPWCKIAKKQKRKYVYYVPPSMPGAIAEFVAAVMSRGPLSSADPGAISDPAVSRLGVLKRPQ